MICIKCKKEVERVTNKDLFFGGLCDQCYNEEIVEWEKSKLKDGK